MKTIGLIPGGMKPFHAGHNFLVQAALEECDSVIVFTSTKDRGVIKGEKMQQAWLDLIQPLLPGLDEVRFVNSPVGSVFLYLEEEGIPDNEYRIYGGIEEIKRFPKSRMKSYYPDLEVVQAAEENPEKFSREKATGVPVSGTKCRQAIEAGDLELFRSYLPPFLVQHAEEYLEILMG